ncbi:MAG: hypothetical protein ACP5T0_02555 [Verrucomicrobiia bacterium]
MNLRNYFNSSLVGRAPEGDEHLLGYGFGARWQDYVSSRDTAL